MRPDDPNGEPISLEERLIELEATVEVLQFRVRELEAKRPTPPPPSAPTSTPPPPFSPGWVAPPRRERPVPTFYKNPETQAAKPEENSTNPGDVAQESEGSFLAETGQEVRDYFKAREERPRQPRPPKDSPADSDEAAAGNEYYIGAKILPKVGAVVLIIGLAFLVSLGVQRGLITPTVLWWGAGILATAVMGVGFYLRKERESFGEILSGIGSAGLFLDFVAGYSVQHLYSLEVFTILALVHSVLSIAYSNLSSSKAFLLLGLFGGLIAADSPHSVKVCAVLIGLVCATTAFSAARKRWVDVCGFVALLGTGTTLILLFYSQPNGLWIHELWIKAAFLVPILVATAGVIYAKADIEPADATSTYPAWLSAPVLAFIPVALILFSDAAFNAISAQRTALEALVYAACLMGISYWKKSPLKNSPIPIELQLRHAVAIVVLLAFPFGWLTTSAPFTSSLAIWLLFLSSLGCLAYTGWKKRLDSWIYGMSALGLMALIILARISTFDKSSFEIAEWYGVLLLIVTASLAAFKALPKASQPGIEPAAVMTSLPFIARIAFLSCPAGYGHAAFVLSVTLVPLLLQAVLWIRRGKEDFSLTLAATFFLSVLYGGFIAQGGDPSNPNFTALSHTEPIAWWQDILVIALLGLVAGALAFAYRTEREIDLDNGGHLPFRVRHFLSLGLTVAVCLRLIYDQIPLVSRAFSATDWTLVLGCVLASVFSFVGARKRLIEPLVIGFVTTLGLVAVYIPRLADLQDKGVVPCLFLALSTLVAYISLVRLPNFKRSMAPYLIGWGSVQTLALLSKLSMITVGSGAVGLNHNASVSLAWTAFAVAILVIGFWRNIIELRFASFAVLAVTVAKVMLVDLVVLDSWIRVLILMVLGAVLLLGGYAYIRGKQAADQRKKVKDPA